MTRTASTTASASAAVLKTEARLFAREPGSVFWVVAFPSLLLTVLGLVPSFREPSDELDGLRTIDLYVPVAVLLAMIMSGLQTMPPVLTGYRERGILRRLSTTPVRPISLLVAQLVVNGAVAVAAAVLPIAVGRLAYDVALPKQPVGYVLALLLAVAVGVALGATISAVTRTQKAATALGTAVAFPTMFTAGLWIPVSAMPDALADAIGYAPFGAAAHALTRAADGSWPTALHLGVLAAWTLVLTCAAARWFRWE
ncbi:ABC transporter permease [Streptomyces sp. NPDC047315]|uniref:ABC transporter permease n=1 Tax=Streptomyces sp. NPDC047315 TaxID=3155142 RepID=UPI0033F1FE0C